MTLDDRISIEKGLDQHLSLRSIALQLGKDPTTISKEIAKGCADPAIIATLTARTLFLDLTIAVCWIKPLLSAMVAVKRIPAASIKPTTAHPLHTGNIKPSLWNQEQVLTFRLLTLLLWMNW